MKLRVILLSLATVLLLSCNAGDEIESYTLKNEAMKTETKIVTNHVAGVIQMNVAQYDCEIVEMGLLARGDVRISVKGTEENLERLFEAVNESTGTASV